MKKYDVYGVGNALVDLLADVDAPFLHEASAGHPKGGMTLVDPVFQRHLLKRLTDHHLHTISGGSGCNTTIGVAHLGGRPKYVGKVGNDRHGAFYKEDLTHAGVHFDVSYSNDPTGTCVILVTPDAQRTMFTHLGCSTTLSPDDIDPEAIKASQWVYLEGYLWDAPGPRAALLKAMQIARDNGIKVAYSFSDPCCVRRARDDLRTFTNDFVDLVFCNEEEALAFTDAEHPHDAIRAIRELKTGVALTRAAAGSIIALGSAVHDIAPCVVDPIDSTGAGDLYAAGVLYGLCQGYDVPTMGQLASKVAAQVVTIRGARLQKVSDAFI